LQQADAALDVVGVVGQGLGHRLAHGLEAGEVDDGVIWCACRVCVSKAVLRTSPSISGSGLAGEGVQALRHVGLAVAEVMSGWRCRGSIGKRAGV
jgi:hydrogenase/urease accessory protein HupE